MDASLVEELVAKNKPFKIETASGECSKCSIEILSAFRPGKRRWLSRTKRTAPNISRLCRFSQSRLRWRGP